MPLSLPSCPATNTPANMRGASQGWHASVMLQSASAWLAAVPMAASFWPQNILLTREGRAKIADVGLAQVLEEEQHKVEGLKTHQDRVLGTFAWAGEWGKSGKWWFRSEEYMAHGHSQGRQGLWVWGCSVAHRLWHC